MFYVSAMMPMMGVQEICHPSTRMDGLGQDPATGAAFGGAVLPIVGAVQSILGVSPAQQAQKQALKLYHAQLLQQKRDAAQAAAEAQAQELAAPSRSLRQSQIVAMYAVGGVAAVTALVILVHALKKRKQQ